MRVLFIVPYPVGKAASQRYRVEQWLPELEAQSISFKIVPFWSVASWAILYRQGHTFRKATGLMAAMLRRVNLIFTLSAYDYVFIHREATPVGPPWFEWIAAKVFRKKLIFDFDDAIWLPNITQSNSVASKYKWNSKVSQICKWSYKVCCGNHYLQNYALQYNSNAVYLPSVLDTADKYNQLKKQQTEKVTIGWIGSHSTLPYLKLIEPVLQQLEQQYTFEFVVIADQKPNLDLRSLRFILWSKENEVADLMQLNIGIMPLPDTEWAKGKCAFKALQYMALGIPAVVSGVGANMTAVPDGITGYTCTTEQEWYEKLEKLLQNAALRSQLGAAGRNHVVQHYSVQAHRSTFLALFT